MSTSNDGHKTHGSYLAYIVGFILSIVLTLAAYFAIVNGWFSGFGALLFVSTLAVLQLLVQLLFFLHMSEEQRPRWNMMTFLYAAMTVVILVIGSIWIMYNLDYNMVHKMTPEEIDRAIIEDEGIYRDSGSAGDHDHHTHEHEH